MSDKKQQDKHTSAPPKGAEQPKTDREVEREGALARKLFLGAAVIYTNRSGAQQAGVIVKLPHKDSAPADARKIGVGLFTENGYGYKANVDQSRNLNGTPENWHFPQ